MPKKKMERKSKMEWKRKKEALQGTLNEVRKAKDSIVRAARRVELKTALLALEREAS